MRSEAHLPACRRSAPVVRFIPGPRRSWRGWIAFLALIALNEARGAYVVIHILRAWSGH